MTRVTDRHPLQIAMWLLLALTIVAAGAARANVTASVNRNRVATNETLMLTLRSDSASMFSSSKPDLSPLQRDFDILGTSTSTEQRIVNGSSSASTTWSIELAPRHTGTLTIPPIGIDGQKTRPITIQAVAPSPSQPPVPGPGQGLGQSQGQAPNAGGNQRGDVFVKASVSSKSVYLTAQLLLTVRVYHRGPLGQGSSLQPQPPDINNALLEQVDSSHYQHFINGTAYNVIEKTWAVFPSQAGKLTIHPFTLRAEVPDPSSTSIFDPFGSTHTVIRRTRPITVDVKPAPSSYHGGDWLPAKQLTLKQSFSSDPTKLHVGQSLTRTITITAHGLMASQLPPLFADKIAGLKVYPDQPKVTDDKSAQGVTGSRQEAIAVVPTHAGNYQLPAVKVHWWDLKTGSERVATLPATTLTVLPAPGGSAASPATPATPTPAAAQPGATPVTAPSAAVRLWPWITAVSLLACALLALLWWHWRERRRWTGQAGTATQPSPEDNDEQNAWRALEAACRSDDPARAHAALYRWLRLASTRADIHCMDDLRRIGVEAALLDAVAQTDAALSGAGSFDAPALLTAATAERKRLGAGHRSTDSGSLPGLYDY